MDLNKFQNCPTSQLKNPHTPKNTQKIIYLFIKKSKSKLKNDKKMIPHPPPPHENIIISQLPTNLQLLHILTYNLQV